MLDLLGCGGMFVFLTHAMGMRAARRDIPRAVSALTTLAHWIRGWVPPLAIR
jgi:hypothetical protein